MTIFKENRIFVIAEIACSHEGNLSLAKEIVKEASKTGTDCIKFQKFYADELVNRSHSSYELYKKLEFSNKEWEELISFSKSKNVKIFVDIFGTKSAKNLKKLNIDGHKIHSSDITNPNLLQYLKKSSLPTLISTAGTYPNEIYEALTIIQNKKKEIVLMHGYQGYPTALSDTNLLRILKLKKHFGYKVGLSDHISGSSNMAMIIPLIGIGLGINVIEKHITLDRSKKGIDYYSSLNPNEFKKFVSLIRKTEQSLGKEIFEFSRSEQKYRSGFKKVPFAKKTIQKMSKLQPKLFEYKRSEKNLEALPYYQFQNKHNIKKISKGEVLTKEYLQSNRVAAIIACRIDSNRMMAKPLQKVDKFSILKHLIIQIKKSKIIEDVVLAISRNPGNEIFVKFAQKEGLKFILGDEQDVLKRLVDGANFVDADIIFRKTSENPFIYWEGIDSLIQSHIKGKFDYSSYGNYLPLGTEFEVINKKAYEISHKFGNKKHRSELCSLYILEHKNKFKIQEVKPPKVLHRSELRLTVDTPEDLILIRKIKKRFRSQKLVKLEQIINYLDDYPELIKINGNIPTGKSRLKI